jgi:hypothetical protein
MTAIRSEHNVSNKRMLTGAKRKSGGANIPAASPVPL